MDFRLFVSRYLGEPCKGSGRWWSWRCQVNRPDSNPSLMVEPNGFKCFSCGVYAERDKGDTPPEVVFLHYEMGYSWQAAWAGVEDYQERPRQETWYEIPGPIPPSDEWRATFSRLLSRCQQELWFSRTTLGAKLLQRRGLLRSTWEHFGLGYNPGWHKVEQFDTWLAPGVVYPAFVNDQLYSLEVRVNGDEPKYHRPRGGSEPTPFGVAQLEGRDVLIVCEGAPDACTAWQVCGGEVDVLGLRGACNTLRLWEQYLCHERVLVATDADEAGDRVAERLLSRYPTWERRRPPEGMDLGDMLREGILSREWLLEGEARL